MRAHPLLALAFAASTFVLACGGATEQGSGRGAANAGESPSGAGVGADDGASRGESSETGTDCEAPSAVLVESGGRIARPAGSVLRLTLVYQGSAIGVRSLNAVDMVIAPSDGPLKEGVHSGYWAETRDATSPLYQRIVRDPTVLEAPASPAGGDFANATVDRCAEKLVLVDVPNDPAATELRIYGSPYGTQALATELARFSFD
jgi:hypothetical protein